MPILPIVIAALAAGGILLIVIALSGGSSVDPVQARLTQLGSMQAKNLEELELQQPFMEPMFANPPEILGLPAGVIILMFGGFMMFLGFMFIRKIVDIEV